MKKVISILGLILYLSAATFGQKQVLTVVPQPLEYAFTAEKFGTDIPALQLIKFYKDTEPLTIAVNDLIKTFMLCKNVSVSARDNPIRILIGIPAGNDKFKNICKAKNLLPGKELGDEGYKLLIDSACIIISANYSKGLFYGIQSLNQIIRGAGNNYLPGLKITDRPAFKYRGVMDDISRGPVPTVDFIKYQIRRLAELKINLFMQYVEHVVKTKSHPAFAPKDGSITIAQWKELAEFARKYNITLAGSFQSFGHFNNILSTPEYARLGECGTLISPVNPESYNFLKDIYSEMVPAFGAPFFNINCDETFDLGKGASKKLADSIGYAGLYYRHIMKLYKILKKLNTETMMWGDILLEYPELLKKIPKDIIVATWTYDNLESYSKYILPIKEAGLKYFAAAGTLNSRKIFPDYRQTFGNINGFAQAAEKNDALGLLNTVWDDNGTALFANDWYGVAYGADKSWNPVSTDSADFDSRFNGGVYGALNNNFTAAIHLLGKLSGLEPTSGMNDNVLFGRVLPDSGKQLRISTDGWDKVSDFSNQAAGALNDCNLKFYPLDKKYIGFICKLYETLAEERFDIIKAAKSYAQVDSLINRNPDKTREAIIKSVYLLNRIIDKEYVLNSTYEQLWLNENHTYALDKVTGNYYKKIDAFRKVKNRLLESLKLLDSAQPPLSIDQAGLAVSVLTGKYFREWLVIKPLPDKDNNPVSQIDYLVAAGGECNTAPKVTDEFYYNSLKYRWTRIASQYEDIVDISDLFPDIRNCFVSYAFASVESDKDTTVNAMAGFAEGMQVFVNGKIIYSHSSAGVFLPDKYSLGLPLRKGKNNLMIKISGLRNDPRFTFRLTECGVVNRKNRYKINFD